jgi:hypothetical protein
LGHFLSCFATFFSGILIAAICCWEVALLTLLVVPLILAIGATYTKKMNTITVAKMIYQSEATSMVEQVRVSKAQLIANHLHLEPVSDLIYAKTLSKLFDSALRFSYYRQYLKLKQYMHLLGRAVQSSLSQSAWTNTTFC